MIDELTDTRLVRVLPEWSLILRVYMVTSDREKQPAKVRHAAEALRAYFNDPRRWRRTQRAQS